MSDYTTISKIANISIDHGLTSWHESTLKEEALTSGGSSSNWLNELTSLLTDLKTESIFPEVKRNLPTFLNSPSSNENSEKAPLLKIPSLGEYAHLLLYSFEKLLKYSRDGFRCYVNGCWELLSENNLQKQIAKALGSNVTSSATKQIIEILKAISFSEDLYPNPEMICFKNGTYNIETGKLEKHSPKHSVLNRNPYNYEPKAKCNLWDEITPNFFNEEADKKVASVEELIGYCLLPYRDLGSIFILTGAPGSNGVRLFLDILSALVGPKNISHVAFDKLEKPKEAAKLLNKLVNIAPEIRDSDVICERELKVIGSGGLIQAQDKSGDHFQFNATSCMIAHTNYLPKLRDCSKEFAGKIIILDFDRIIPERELNIDLYYKLINEASGILANAIKRVNNLLKRGKFLSLETSKIEVNQILRDQLHLLYDFIKIFEVRPVKKGKFTTTNIWKFFNTWLDKWGLPQIELSTFGKMFKQYGFTSRKSNGKKYWNVVLIQDLDENKND